MDQIILDFKLWDYIDQLWAYLVDLIENFILNNNSETLFPDQPIKVKLKKLSDEYLILILENNDHYTWTLPKQEIFITLLNESQKFFTNITEGLNLSNYFGTYGNWELGINTETGVVYHAIMR